MPNLTIRQVDSDVVNQVKVIAAQNGRSMQQELRLLVNRFVSLPVESRRALLPIAALPLPEWYIKLWHIRTDIGSVTHTALPVRRSQFRHLEMPRTVRQ
ncbi:FitA-like ribbon-helix-helix domain-containing protein [Arthrobacter sp. HLT1-21]